MISSTRQHKRRQAYDLACLLTLGITLIFLTLAILTSLGADIPWDSPLVGLLLALGCILTAVGIFMRKPCGNLPKDIGFYAMHIGLVVLLIGFGIFEISGDSIHANVPIGSETFYANISRENGEVCSLGFNFRITDFHIDYHEDGSEKQYRADIEFADAVSLRIDRDELSVNHTIRKNGWRIYLMSYSEQYVNLMFRYDPGETLVKVGVWMTAAGTLLSLLAGNLPTGKQKEDEE